MKILIACEESQEVCKAFRAKGHEAYSADLKSCSGGFPEWHIKGDVLPLLNGDCTFFTEGGHWIRIDGEWDMIIAHPPCTYLTNSATRHFSLKCTPAEKVMKRWSDRCEAAIFFMQCALARCDRIAVENPIGFMSHWRKPDQIIQPWMFAETESENVTKATCLWLKGLEPLKYPKGRRKPESGRFGYYPSGKAKTWEDLVTKDRATTRSKTFHGVAKAMADQWG